MAHAFNYDLHLHRDVVVTEHLPAERRDLPLDAGVRLRP